MAVDRSPERRDGEVARQALIKGGVVTLLVLAVLAAWYLGSVLLIVFGAVLFAVLLRAIADPLHRWTRLPPGVGSLLVAIALLAALGGVGAFAGPALAEQAAGLSDRVPRALEVLGEASSRLGLGDISESGEVTVAELRSTLAQRGSDALSWVTGVVGSVTAALTAGVFIVLAGIYLAVQPGTYRRGLVGLVPSEDREHAADVLAAVGGQLRGWLFGQLAAMTVVGVLTAIGLTLIGIPLALLLSVVAFLLAFIPNLGPLIALVLALLVTLVDDPGKMWWVFGLYMSVQFLESYLITPLIQRRAADIPPALLLATQLVFGAMYGFLGLLMAAPLTAAILVLVQRLWRGDVLGDVLGDEVPEGEPA